MVDSTPAYVTTVPTSVAAAEVAMGSGRVPDKDQRSEVGIGTPFRP
jgi:hypothetical protein